MGLGGLVGLGGGEGADVGAGGGPMGWESGLRGTHKRTRTHTCKRTHTHLVKALGAAAVVARAQLGVGQHLRGWGPGAGAATRGHMRWV